MFGVNVSFLLFFSSLGSSRLAACCPAVFLTLSPRQGMGPSHPGLTCSLERKLWTGHVRFSLPGFAFHYAHLSAEDLLLLSLCWWAAPHPAVRLKIIGPWVTLPVSSEQDWQLLLRCAQHTLSWFWADTGHFLTLWRCLHIFGRWRALASDLCLLQPCFLQVGMFGEVSVCIFLGVEAAF